MDDQTQKLVTTACAIWGAGISTLLGLVKLWETFWKDRIRLRTTYSFYDLDELTDKITVVNLSSVTVQVSHWTLAWKPRPFRWRTSTIDVTPHEEISMFTIRPKDSYKICFEEGFKFDWGYRNARHRALVLTLHIFGRRRPKVLKVAAGL